ncbi:replication factor RFC1 C terminal domain-containing protein, partial [Zopfochytrium polystomum]
PSAPGSKDIPVGAEDCLKGLSFVFTGELSSISRDKAQDLVKEYGGRVVGSVSGKTSYVIVGEEPGESKLRLAAEKKIKVLDEDQFFDLIRSKPANVDVPAPTSSRAKKVKVDDSQPEKPSRANTAATTNKATDGKGKPRQESELWTTKYKPQKYQDILGNKTNVERLANWLRSWHTTEKDMKSTAKDDPSPFKAVLISGPPGIGKTTAAHLVSTLEGFEPIEFNASDTRSKNSVKAVVKEISDSHTVTSYFDRTKSTASRHVLIMDECDGMTGSDRGGIAELILVIKKTKIPIICICNDRMSPKVKSLANYCYDMRFIRPSTAQLEKSIRAIAEKEGLTLKDNVVDTLVKSTNNDIRQILTMLSQYALNHKELNFSASKKLAESSEKIVAPGPWDATGSLLSKGSFRELPFGQKIELYFADHSLMPLMIQENFIKMEPALAQDVAKGRGKAAMDLEVLNCLSQAADSIAASDIVGQVLHKTQSWTLMPFHGVMSTVRPAFFSHGTMALKGPAWGGGGGYTFPGWLGKNSTQSKSNRLLKEIQLHMRLQVSASRNEIRESYLPVLAPRITLPLVQDNDGIDEVIGLLDSYYLNREDWDVVLDLGLNECSAKALTSKIPTATKTAFTRTYNKSNHPKPFMTTAAVTKSKATREADFPDLEDVVDVDDDIVVAEDENGETDSEDVGGDRLITVKKSTGSSKSSAASGKSGSSSGGAKKGAGSKGGKKRT